MQIDGARLCTFPYAVPCTFIGTNRQISSKWTFSSSMPLGSMPLPNTIVAMIISRSRCLSVLDGRIGANRTCRNRARTHNHGCRSEESLFALINGFGGGTGITQSLGSFNTTADNLLATSPPFFETNNVQTFFPPGAVACHCARRSSR